MAERDHSWHCFRTSALERSTLRRAQAGRSTSLVRGAGRGGDAFVGCPTASAEICDPATGRFSLVGSLANASLDPQAALLRDGRVLIVGGWNLGGQGLASAEVFDPTTDTFSPTGSMSAARRFCTAASLADGQVLVVGGDISTGFLASAEVYAP